MLDGKISCSCDLLSSGEPQTCDLGTVLTAVAKSQVPRPDGPSCDNVLFASTTLPGVGGPAGRVS
jgi:hypothetical protein